jgi:hypothetical protein
MLPVRLISGSMSEVKELLNSLSRSLSSFSECWWEGASPNLNGWEWIYLMLLKIWEWVKRVMLLTYNVNSNGNNHLNLFCLIFNIRQQIYIIYNSLQFHLKYINRYPIIRLLANLSSIYLIFFYYLCGWKTDVYGSVYNNKKVL